MRDALGFGGLKGPFKPQGGKMRKAIGSLCFAAAFLAGAGLAEAHHSFAAFFDSEKTTSITGKVTKFVFANPHGTIELDVKGAGSKTEAWRVETNAPVLLKRLGWTKESIRVGQTITIVGWPSRDGAKYVRLQRATDEAGKPIGRSMATGDQQ
jgi:hypothetical protein